MRTSPISVRVLRAAFILTALCVSHAVYAVTFSVTPNSITDQSTALITFQIGGLNSGETVTVQKFVDANFNGVVDTGDFLGQSFQLTDSQGPPVIAGVTNINVPGDLDPAIGTITAHLNPVIESFGARIVAQYIFVVSSPTSRFSPVTALFTVTPFFTRQSISGNVTCNGTNVPDALILLLLPPSQSKSGFKPYGGALADNAGAYSLKLAPGNYSFAAFKNGFVTDTTKPASVTLTTGGAVTANLSLIPATATISGRLIDAAFPSPGLPGLLLGAQSSAGLFSLATTSSDGNFALSVTSGQWGIGVDESGLDVLDLVGSNGEFKADTTPGSVAGLTFAFPKATAYIYGSVRDAQNNPLPAIRLSGDNGLGGSGAYNGDATTDQNGNYVMAVNAGLWSPSLGGSGKNPALRNYIVSGGPAWTFNNGGNGTNLSAGTVAQANFFALAATNSITGTVKDGGGNPIANVQVYAFSTINGNTFNQSANSDSQGNYKLNAGNGVWTVGVNCCANCGGNSLPSNYPCPNQQTVNILNADAVANFAAIAVASFQVSGTLTDGSGHPIPNIQVYALPTIGGVTFPAPDTGTTTDANGNYSLSVTNGTWTMVVSCCGGGIGNNCDHALDSNIYQCPNQQIVHISNGKGSANFVAIAGVTYQISGSVTDNNGNGVTNLTVTASPAGNSGIVVTAVTRDGGNFILNVETGMWSISVDCNGLSSRGFTCPGIQNVQVDASGNFTSFTVQPCGPLQLNTTTLPAGFIGSRYTFQLLTFGCHPPFTWSLSPGSLPLPQGLSLSTNGTIEGSPSIAGTNYLSVRVRDGQGNKADGLLSIGIYPQLRITNSGLPNGTLAVPYSAQIMATGGSSIFFGANVASGTLPPGLTLAFDGNIFGTPTQLGVFSFTVQVNDNSGLDNAQAPFTIVISQPNLQITATSVTGGLVGQPFSFQLQTSGGTAPIVWSVALGSQPLPAGLTLSPEGLISGAPGAAGVSTVIIRVTDANSLTATASVQITVNSASTLPKLSSPVFSLSNGFEFAVSAPTGQSYRVQYSVELTNWFSLLVTNPPVTPFTIVDRAAASQHRFYRLVLPGE